MKKTIKYFVASGVEIVVNAGDSAIIRQLTGKPLNSVTRELIRDLSGGRVTFEKV